LKILPVVKPLKLTNDGTLEIVFLGVGGAFSQTLFNTNFIIIKGDAHLLVDFGTTGPFALAASTGLTLSDISAILPTHSHCDHIGGIESLALWNRYVAIPQIGKPKLSMIISKEYQHILWDYSLRGGMEQNEMSSEGNALLFEDYFTIFRPTYLEREPRLRLEIDWQGIHIELFGTNHVPEQASSASSAFITHGLYIDNKVFFSGDTKFDIELFEMYADKSEIMFHDTSFFPNPVHASLQELMSLPQEIKQKLMLVHYGDNWQQQNVEDFVGLAQQGCRYIFD
jgi:ribonuclease BN (tRNA processing enzyme)